MAEVWHYWNVVYLHICGLGTGQVVANCICIYVCYYYNCCQSTSIFLIVVEILSFHGSRNEAAAYDALRMQLCVIDMHDITSVVILTGTFQHLILAFNATVIVFVNRTHIDLTIFMCKNLLHIAKLQYLTCTLENIKQICKSVCVAELFLNPCRQRW